MPIETLRLSDPDFDAALERYAVVDETLVPKTELGREPESDEILDRYAFTAFVEAVRSEEFEEDPFLTANELELMREFNSADDAWRAIVEFYASRDCVLLEVGGDTEQFVVGREIARRFGWLQA
jgi:hypothetical protein